MDFSSIKVDVSLVLKVHNGTELIAFEVNPPQPPILHQKTIIQALNKRRIINKINHHKKFKQVQLKHQIQHKLVILNQLNLHLQLHPLKLQIKQIILNKKRIPVNHQEIQNLKHHQNNPIQLPMKPIPFQMKLQVII
jgi:hypothetical protein